MKELYFTPQTLERQALELYQLAGEFSREKNITFHPMQSALLVLDMQEYFLSSTSHAYIPSAEAIVPGIIHLVEAFSSYKRPIFFTQHINTEGDAAMMSMCLSASASPISACESMSNSASVPVS